jgi:hypothetical protein
MNSPDQEDLTANEEKPGAVPNRPLRQSELVELKILARTAKEGLSTFYRGLQTWNLAEQFDSTDERVDNTGRLCDEVINFCKEELRKSDLPKKRKRKS